MASNPLIGTYRLVSWENKSVQDGQISHALSKDPAGCIMCNQDGYMPVAIMKSTPPKVFSEVCFRNLQRFKGIEALR